MALTPSALRGEASWSQSAVPDRIAIVGASVSAGLRSAMQAVPRMPTGETMEAVYAWDWIARLEWPQCTERMAVGWSHANPMGT